MKILIVTPIFPPEIGGPATYSFELLSRLPPEIDTSIVTFAPNSKSLSNIEYVAVTGNPLFRQIRLFFAVWKKSREVDLIYVQEPHVVGLPAWLTTWLQHKPLLTKYVGDLSWETSQLRKSNRQSIDEYFSSGKQKRSWIHWQIRFILSQSLKVITPAPYLKEILTKYYNLPPQKIVIIPNSVEIPQLETQKANNFIFVGRLVPWKNTLLIISAFAQVVKGFPNSNLVIVGSGPMELEIRKLILKLKLSTKVQLLGNLKHTQTLKQIAESSILVLYSTYEGLSHLILEAMSVQTAVIASDIPGNREVINNRNGILVPLGSEKLLSEKMRSLLEKKVFRQKIIKQAKSDIARSFNWKRNLTKLKQLFYEVVDK